MAKSSRRRKKSRTTRGPLRGLDRRYDVQEVGSIDVAVLETFPYEYPGRRIVVNIDTDEFSARCPYSGLPDFSTVRINYIPGTRLLELRSVKYYLLSYRNVGIYKTHAVNKILNDLASCCRPKWMQVIADYRIRG